jgi:hypothetical protein
VALLALDTGVDMGRMIEAYEIGQRINPVPSHFKRRLCVIDPGLTDRTQRHLLRQARMTANTTLDWRHSGVFRAARVFMAELAGNVMVSGVNEMTEGNWLYHV